MYVLYYQYSDYDEHQFQVLAVSEDKHVLEFEIEKLMRPIREYRHQYEVYNASVSEYRARSQAAVRKWLMSNPDCVREIRPQLFNGKFYVKDFHTLNNKPYDPNVKKREIEKAIDVIVSTHWQLFLENPTKKIIEEQDKFINKEALNGPVLAIPHEKYESPKVPIGDNYMEGCLSIVEVPVL